jgi:hypothetical protein
MKITCSKLGHSAAAFFCPKWAKTNVRASVTPKKCFRFTSARHKRERDTGEGRKGRGGGKGVEGRVEEGRGGEAGIVESKKILRIWPGFQLRPQATKGFTDNHQSPYSLLYNLHWFNLTSCIVCALLTRSLGSDVVNDFIAHLWGVLLINKNVKWSADEKAEILPPQFLRTCSM